jgi:hypothetical protein
LSWESQVSGNELQKWYSLDILKRIIRLLRIITQYELLIMISWNEIAQYTHIKPMQKWGNTSFNVLSSLIGGGDCSKRHTAHGNTVGSHASQYTDQRIHSDKLGCVYLTSSDGNLFEYGL